MFCKTFLQYRETLLTTKVKWIITTNLSYCDTPFWFVFLIYLHSIRKYTIIDILVTRITLSRYSPFLNKSGGSVDYKDLEQSCYHRHCSWEIRKWMSEMFEVSMTEHLLRPLFSQGRLEMLSDSPLCAQLVSPSWKRETSSAKFSIWALTCTPPPWQHLSSAQNSKR